MVVLEKNSKLYYYLPTTVMSKNESTQFEGVRAKKVTAQQKGFVAHEHRPVIAQH